MSLVDTNILLIDDNSDNLRILIQILSERGYSVRPAINGEVAFNAIKQRVPNLILLDIMMPGLSGYEVCERLKANSETKDVPVIFISAMDDPENKVKAFSKGGVDYITKPFHKEEVLARVETHLKINQLRISLQEKNIRLEQEVSERMQAEQALRKIRDELEYMVLKRTDELSDANKRLRKAKERAEKASRVKSEFLANVSHEIRTPMNAILGYSDIIESKVFDEQLIKYLSRIKSSGQALVSLIDDLLDLSEIEAGLLEPFYEPVPVRPLFNEINYLFLPEVIEKGLLMELSVSPDIPEQVILDRIRLKQVLINLVGNAVKFTESGTVSLSVALLETEDGRENSVNLVFTVKDTGPGIPESQLAEIFKAFHQVSEVAIHHTGLGLGLTIAQRLVQTMNGELNVETEPEKGSCFFVTFLNVDIP